MKRINTKSGLEIMIRQETPKDYSEVDVLVKQAFAIVNQFDVAEYLIEVRQKDTFIPELSFVAVLADGKIVGQITLYKTDIITETERITQLVLSPISVLPEYFNNDIASEMIAFSLQKAKEMDYFAVFLQGNPDFYNKFGFEQTSIYGINHETENPK